MEEFKEKPRRVAGLDLLRGLAVAGMIVVDSPGDWGQAYAPLLHAEWNGWTPTDMVFPTFLFCVGMAWAFSFPRDETKLPALWLAILKRTAILIMIGLVINALPYFDLAHLRIPGILQRIALCYLLTAAFTLVTAHRQDGKLFLNLAAFAIATPVVLIGYWAMLRFVPVPGFGAGHLDSLRALPAWADRGIFTADHLWNQGTTEGVGVTYDPEGLLSTLGAVVSCFTGVLAAIAYRALPERRRLIAFAVAGMVLMVAAYLVFPGVPINKRLWTSSFVLLSAGFSLLALCILLLVPVRGVGALLTYPLRVLGSNAILAFILCQLFGVLTEFSFIPSAEGPLNPQQWGFRVASGIFADPYMASLACALGILAIILLMVAPLHRRGIYLRV
jgi:predicted acyltransferase